MSEFTMSAQSPSFVIEDGVPVPEVLRKTKYPWDELSVSQSFFVPGGNINSLITNARSAGNRRNKKFLCRVVDSGVRVWRTE